MPRTSTIRSNTQNFDLAGTNERKTADSKASHSGSGQRIADVAFSVFKMAAVIAAPLALAYLCQDTKVSPASQPFVSLPNLHPNEQEAFQIFGEGILKLDVEDPRPKMLYLFSEYDHNGALKMSQPFPPNLLKNMSPEDQIAGDYFFKALGLKDGNIGVKKQLQSADETHDIRYKGISSIDQMCKEIATASKVENLKSLIIHAHGSETGIALGEIGDQTMYIDKWNTLNVPANCFAGLPPDLEIIMLSCNTGSSEDAIASAVSKLSQKVVWAPWKPLLTYDTILSKDPHPVPAQCVYPGFPADIELDIFCKFSPDGSRVCRKWEQISCISKFKALQNYLVLISKEWLSNKMKVFTDSWPINK